VFDRLLVQDPLAAKLKWYAPTFKKKEALFWDPIKVAHLGANFNPFKTAQRKSIEVRLVILHKAGTTIDI